MKLSIVATLYKSAPHISEFYERCTIAAKKSVGEDYEIVLVNDGSPDDSLQLAVQLTERDPHVIVVELSRNFGHHKAIMTGLAQAQGERVFLIDSDLEEPPELLAEFTEQLEHHGCDVVFGIQISRRGGWFERWSGRAYYWLLRAFTGAALPENIVTVRLMTRAYVDALLRHQEREVNIAGLWLITGFDQRSHAITKARSSQSTYDLRKKLAILVNSITSFSNAPLIFIFNFGLIISFFSLLYMIFVVVNWMFFAEPPSGWTSVIASIWLLGGMMISFIGILGIYLSKIFLEVKQRPYTIIRRVYGKQRH